MDSYLSTVFKLLQSCQPGGLSISSSDVFVNYINDNKSYRVKGKGAVLACYNMMIPHIVSDLPEEQTAALRRSVKIALQYPTIGFKNWRAMKKSGIGMAISHGNIHQVAMMDFLVSMSGYNFAKKPDYP